MRIAFLMLAIIALFAIPVLIFGDHFDELLMPDRLIALLREQGFIAALVGIAAISADLVIPTPAHAIMAAFGLVYGWLVGGLLATMGTFIAGMIAYCVSRFLGQKAAGFIAGERDMARLARFFTRHGFVAIMCSRWIPLVPEVISCLAGVTEMPVRRFALGNLIGSASVGFFYAALGFYYGATPAQALTISLILPAVLLPIFFIAVVRSQDRLVDEGSQISVHEGAESDHVGNNG